MQITVRTMNAQEIPAVGQFIARAFNEVFDAHGYAPPFGSVRDGIEIARWYHHVEPEDCYVAEIRGQALAAAFLHRRGPRASIGPVAVDPRYQKLGLGRRLMEHVLEAAASCTSLRLFQDAFNPDSFALYAKLAFRPVEIVPIVMLLPAGLPNSTTLPSICRVGPEAAPVVAELDAAWTGGQRIRDLQYLLETGVGFVMQQEGRNTGYLCAYSSRGGVYVGPAVAETEDQLHALLHAARSHYRKQGLIFRMPGCNSGLLHRLLSEGFRISSLGTFLVRGEWQPSGAAELLAVFPESL